MISPSTIPITKVVIEPDQEAAVLRVLRSGNLAQGPVVAQLEQAFAQLCGVRHAVAVSNGTVALVAALSALDLHPGDEVITTPFSFAATLNAVLSAGATVRFADIRDDFTLDPDAVSALVNERTKVLLPVHLYGLPADLPALESIASRAGLALVEDAAQAHGAQVASRVVGSWGIGCFSFYATKNLQCGEGGLVTTSDDRLAARLRLLRNQGMRERYQYELPGHNWRLTDLQAAIAVPQVDRLDQTIAARAANAARLTEGLAGLPGLLTPTVPAGRTHVWHQYTIRVTEGAPVTRDELVKHLEHARIGFGLYYPSLMHDYPCYVDHPQVVADPTPAATAATAQVLSLPVNQFLSAGDLDRIIATVREIFGD
ncbi:MAG: DegT/DnrJ/EryC1/StrS family aminotransferase [Dactylosporangium sp.]|nr:DegT/DnrJ/EryC1/StrS family aminotransferase [Dactylosporangium sp.]NNJ63733.1 DegT/DnrJ/EryC1/StrS family aminotransferase [Dactylosporangium sp.]